MSYKVIFGHFVIELSLLNSFYDVTDCFSCIKHHWMNKQIRCMQVATCSEEIIIKLQSKMHCLC